MALTNNKVTFGRGNLSNMPTGVGYADMLYFAKDAKALYMNGQLISSGLLDMEYYAVLTDEARQVDFTNNAGPLYGKNSLGYPGSGISSLFSNVTLIDPEGSASDPWNWSTASIEKGSYILYQKIYNENNSNREVRWYGIILSSDITPEALQMRIEEVAAEVEVLEGDVSTLKNDVSTLKSDVSTLKSDVSILSGTTDSRITNIENILEINNTETSARIDRIDLSIGYIKQNYINDVSVALPLEFTKSGTTIEGLLHYGEGLTISNNNLIVDSSSSIFDGLGSYSIEKQADGSWVLTKKGVPVQGSAIIDAPTDQFLESVEVSTGTGPYADVSVLLFTWKLTDGSVTSPQQVPLSEIFPGVIGKSGEVIVNEPGMNGNTTGKWQVALDSSVTNRIQDISTSLETLENIVDNLDIPVYTGVTSNGVDVSINASNEISASILWNDFN